MALFGFAINFKTGATDFALVSGQDAAQAEAKLREVGPADYEIESITPCHDAEALVSEQYEDVAVLSNVFYAGGE